MSKPYARLPNYLSIFCKTSLMLISVFRWTKLSLSKTISIIFSKSSREKFCAIEPSNAMLILSRFSGVPIFLANKLVIKVR